MKLEEAIVYFESLLKRFEEMRETETSYWGKVHTETTIEAIRTALAALRPVSRERVEKVWSPCNFCAGAKYITGGVTAVYPVSETRQQEAFAEGDFDFCPVCGRPMTDEAVEMVMERLEALNDGKGD